MGGLEGVDAVARSIDVAGMGNRQSVADAFHVVQAFIDRARATRTTRELALLMEQITRDMGFDYYALIHHVDHRMDARGVSIRLENYPRAWVDIFLERELFSWDPIHLASYSTNVAFAWSDVPDMIQLSKRHKAVLKAAALEGLGDGFTVPANLPGEANGSCSFAVRVGRDLPRERLVMVQTIGSFAFQAARDLALEAFPSAAPHGRVALSPRQLDCVLLAGRGKSDWEIGQILGLKQTTVTEYLDAARDRYGVARRVQVILRAVHDGHIALSDLLR